MGDAGESEQVEASTAEAEGGATADTKVVRPTPPPQASASTNVAPAVALRYAEIKRTRAFIGLTLLATMCTIASLPFFSGDPTLELIATISLSAGTIAGAAYYWWIRDPERYSTRSFTVLAASAVFNAQLIVVYFGVFSAGTTVMVVGIYFFSRVESRYAPPVVYAVAASLQAICAAAIIAGVVRDPGLLSHADLPVIELIGTQLLIQILYFVAFWIGRSTLASTQEAVEGLQQAMVVAARRGALLDEARDELDRALQVGDAGPFSDRIIGGYVLGAVIGRGAMGDVYEASHAQSGRLAAVKLLPTSVLGDARVIERFLREAKAASALESPHVVRVLATSSPTEPVPYMVMERLLGSDLAHELRQGRRLTTAEVVELARQVGSVVDLAREHGVVHRDLKPQNIFLDKASGGAGVWKVLDFGVAALREHGGTLTHGHVVGTPAYMAPEQARSGAVDHRADLHALTAVLYRCVTGRPAFSGRDVPALLYDVAHKMPDRPGLQVDVPADVDAVLAIGLAKNRDDRFDSGRELAAAFAAAWRGELAPQLRQRAADIVARTPWGVRQ